jgi:glycosyltransferase involved in cell wall biosynthesis
MEKKKVILVIPAYNEEACILNTTKKIDQYNKKNKTKIDYIVINDGSKDSTEDILVKNKINHVKLIQNLGIGGAVQTGYKYAYEHGYDIAVQYDGDGQHDVAYVEKLVKPIIEGKASMTIGSRFIDNKSSEFKSSAARRLGIKLISGCIKFKTGKRIYDTTSGFRAIDRNIMKMFIDSYPVEYPEPISTVNVLLNKNKIEEIPVSMNERTTGKSSISSWKNAYYMINVIMSILVMKRGK